MSLHVLDQVKFLRVSKGWSQSSLAEMSGVSLRTIQRIEKGFPASLETAKSLAATFNLGGISDLVKPDLADADTASCPGQAQRKPVLISSAKLHHKRSVIAFGILIVTMVLFTFIVEKLGIKGSSGGQRTIADIVEAGPMYVTAYFASSFPLLCLVLFFIYKGCNTWFKIDARSRKSNMEVKYPWAFFKAYNVGNAILSKNLEGYLSCFQIQDNVAPIGVDIDSMDLVVRDVNNHDAGLLIVGENGSNAATILVEQCFYLLCQQRSGLVFISEKEATVVNKFRAALTMIGRQGDLVVCDIADVEYKDAAWWGSLKAGYKIVVVNTPHESTPAVSWIIDCYMADVQAETGGNKLRPFLMLQDIHLIDPAALLLKLKTEKTGSGLVTVLWIRDANGMLEKSGGRELMAYFPSKILMKMHDQLSAKKLLGALGRLEDEGFNARTLIAHGIGKATYLCDDLIWPHVNLIHLNFDKLAPGYFLNTNKENLVSPLGHHRVTQVALSD